MGTSIFRWVLAAAAAAALVPSAAMAEPEDGGGAWRVSVGYRAAPGIKTSARIDAGAAARAAGFAAGSPARRGTSTANLGTTVSGEDGAAAAAEYEPGKTRYDFDNGFIDMDDGSGHEGDTMNWQFRDAAAFSDGYISATKNYERTTVSRSRTTETEATSSAWFADDLSGSSTETGHGAEIRLERTLWDNGRFGVGFGAGWAWFAEVDTHSIRGRAASGTSSVRTKTTETETTESVSGSVTTRIDAREFTLDDIYNPSDGSIGAAYFEGGSLAYDHAPVLAVGPDTFSTETVRNPARTSTSSSTKTSTRGQTRTIDVRSDGTLSLQELRAGFQPFWKATDWLAFRADLGMVAVYSEIETRTEVFADGTRAAVARRDETDWTFAGYAGLGVSVAVGRHVELFAGADARFPDGDLRFDDGIVSGTVDLAKWSATAGVCVSF